MARTGGPGPKGISAFIVDAVCVCVCCTWLQGMLLCAFLHVCFFCVHDVLSVLHPGFNTHHHTQASPGVSYGKQESKLGWNSQPTATVMLDNVRVPAANRLGEEGEGFSFAMKACMCCWGLVLGMFAYMAQCSIHGTACTPPATVDGGRINIAACSVGGAQFCIDYAVWCGPHTEYIFPLLHPSPNHNPRWIM